MAHMFNHGLGPQSSGCSCDSGSGNACQANPMGNHCCMSPLGPTLTPVLYTPAVTATITPFTMAQKANIMSGGLMSGGSRRNVATRRNVHHGSNPRYPGVL